MVRCLGLSLALLLAAAGDGACGGSPPKDTGTAPPIRQKDTAGKILVLSEVAKQKPVLLFFWHQASPYCRAQLPYVQRTARDLQGKLAVVVVDCSDRGGGFPGPGRGSGGDLRTIIDLKGAVAKAYQVKAFPTTFFIRRGGKVAKRMDGFDANRGFADLMGYLTQVVMPPSLD